MATRYYLSNTAAAAVSPAFDLNWADTASWKDDRFKMPTAKSNSVLTDETSSTIGTGKTCTIAGTGRYLMRQWVSDQIGVFNFNTTTVSLVIRGLVSGTGSFTSTLNLSVRLYHTDGTFATLLTLADFDTALGNTAATRIVNAAALANVSSQNKDRLVVEIGANVSVQGSLCRTNTLRDGDNAASDFALTSGLTTDLNPWVEFSGNVPAPSTSLAGLPIVILQSKNRAASF